jgi:Arc/MetJ-type ribon-helix-helix transcriptional regulator
LYRRKILTEGVFQDEAEVLREALRLLQKRQQLLRDVNAGVAQLDQGQFSEYDEDSLEQFLNDVRVVHGSRNLDISLASGSSSKSDEESIVFTTFIRQRRYTQ